MRASATKGPRTKVNLLPNGNTLKCKPQKSRSDPRIGVHSIDEIVDLSVVLTLVALVRLFEKQRHRDHEKEEAKQKNGQ